jgi:hypothetical protein
MESAVVVDIVVVVEAAAVDNVKTSCAFLRPPIELASLLEGSKSTV